jgi:hypothetical protein
MFKIKGMPNRIQASYVHNAWAVVDNIADHKTLITLAAFNTPLMKMHDAHHENETSR